MIRSVLKTFAPVATASLTALASMTAQAADYQVDVSHSKVGFSVKHMMVSNVEGRFKDFEGTFNFDPAKGTLGATNFVVKTASVTTDNDKRDEHLRGADFFDAEKNPTMTITNSKIVKAGKDKYTWTGDLTMRGVSKPVKFDLAFNGSGKNPWGQTVAGFTATGKISRKDYGMAFNKTLETGGVLVGDDVNIKLEIQAAEAAKADAAKPADSKPAAKK